MENKLKDKTDKQLFSSTSLTNTVNGDILKFRKNRNREEINGCHG